MIEITAIKEFREIYNESGIITPYSDYIRKMNISLVIIFSITFIVTLITYNVLYHLSYLKLFLIIISFCLISTNLAAFLYLTYPLYKRNQVRKKIENGLIYTVSYMKIIASSGSNIITIMEHVANIDNNYEIRKLANKFVTNVKLLGFDVSTALKDISNRTSSNVFKKLLQGINHNINTSGNLVNLFNYEITRMFNRKREELKSLTQSLTYIGEMYVALMVIGPILFILMIIILSVFLGGGTASTVRLNLIVFFGLPVLASMFLVILDTILEGDE
jgi:flagellar protein FlaJ